MKDYLQVLKYFVAPLKMIQSPRGWASLKTAGLFNIQRFQLTKLQAESIRRAEIEVGYNWASHE